MDGEVQPKFGLMVSLLLMNLTAIALFFFATPTPREIPKKQTGNAENVPIQADMVLAGDAQTKNGDENVSAVTPSDEKKGSRRDSIEGVVSSKRVNKVDSMSPRISPAEVQALPGKVEMRVVTSKKTMETDGPAEPPLAVALKKFVGSTESGVRLVFEGLKNGYTKKRTRDSSANNTRAILRKITEGGSESTRPVSKTIELRSSVKASSPQNMKNLPQERSPPRKLPKPPFSPEEDENCSNLETIPTEIVMDALSRAQKRTNELINVFSKRVVPAIERMNERVAEAIRLEKNLDSYTSTLINAINSVVCPSTSERNLGRNESKQRTSAVKKPKHAKAFSSEPSVMRDSQIRDYVGSHSKGEHSSVIKRPVFKTLAARFWHTRHRRVVNKTKKRTSRPDELARPEGSEEFHFKGEHLIAEHGTAGDVFVQTEQSETKDDEETDNVSGSFEFTDPSCQRTIGIEDVLALKSSLEQSSNQGIQSDIDHPCRSPVNSDPSMTSGVACRSCAIERPEPENTEQSLTEDETDNVTRKLKEIEFPESGACQSLELSEDSNRQARPRDGAVCSDFSIVCDSRIQGYESSLLQNGISTVCAYKPSNEDQNVPTHLQTAKGIPKREEPISISLSANVENTMELVNVFQRLSFKQKEVAMESVCLLVMRIFEAWTESQRSVSSLGLSRISLSSWPSTDEVSSQCNRPRTAICRSRIDSCREPQSIMVMDNCVTKDGTSEYKPSKPAPNEVAMDADPTSAEISQTLVQNVVEATEIRIAEKSLVGLRANVLRHPPSKGDVPKSCVDSADRSGFGDIKDEITTMNEELAASLLSKSRESFKVSKESSAATFYTGQPESSEDAFYECTSTLSAGTCGSRELEVKDSSTLFLERIQEEETRVQPHAVSVAPEAAGSSFSIESWLTDSAEELITAKETLNSDNSSCYVGCATDDEAYPCSSQELSADEFKPEEKNAKDRSKKKKWAAKFLNKFLKKKSKHSSFPSVALSKSASRSQSDYVLKPSDHHPDLKDGQ